MGLQRVLTMREGVRRLQMPNKQWLATYACLVFIAVELLYLYAYGVAGDLTVLWNGKGNGAETRLDEVHVMDTAVSAYVGGVPGYTVFDNLWFHDGHFHYFDNSPVPLDGALVMKDRDSIISHSVDELESLLKGQGEESRQRFRGETIFINTGYGSGSVPRLVQWYYHFATELIMGSMSDLSSLHPREEGDTLPSWVVVPESDWKDHYGLNEFLVAGTFTADSVIDQAAWRSHEHKWIRFDRVVIADREASGQDPEVQAWNKMAAHALTLRGRSTTAFEPLRESMLRHLHLHLDRGMGLQEAGAGRDQVPKVVYVDRQDTSRHLSDEGHRAIVDTLSRLHDEGKVQFTHGRFGQGAMKEVKEQVKAVIDADIMVGVHGNGLTHMLFMPTGGQVIEIFPPNTFLRDYQLVAEALSHTHHAVRNDTTYPRAEWETHPGEQNPDALHDGSVIPLDASYISDVLHTIVEEVTMKGRRREKRRWRL